MSPQFTSAMTAIRPRRVRNPNRVEVTCCNFVEDDGLGGSSSQSHAHPLKQLLLGEQEVVAG